MNHFFDNMEVDKHRTIVLGELARIGDNKEKRREYVKNNELLLVFSKLKYELDEFGYFLSRQQDFINPSPNPVPSVDISLIRNTEEFSLIEKHPNLILVGEVREPSFVRNGPISICNIPIVDCDSIEDTLCKPTGMEVNRNYLSVSLSDINPNTTTCEGEAKWVCTDTANKCMLYSNSTLITERIETDNMQELCDINSIDINSMPQGFVKTISEYHVHEREVEMLKDKYVYPKRGVLKGGFTTSREVLFMKVLSLTDRYYGTDTEDREYCRYYFLDKKIHNKIRASAKNKIHRESDGFFSSFMSKFFNIGWQLKEKVAISPMVYQVSEYIRNNCCLPNVYRESGDQEKYERVAEHIVNNQDICLTNYSLHNIVSGYKMYIRKCIDGIMDPGLIQRVHKIVAKGKDSRYRGDVFALAASTIDAEYRILLCDFINTLRAIGSHTAETKVTYEGTIKLVVPALFGESILDEFESINYFIDYVERILAINPTLIRKSLFLKNK